MRRRRKGGKREVERRIRRRKGGGVIEKEEESNRVEGKGAEKRTRVTGEDYKKKEVKEIRMIEKE